MKSITNFQEQQKEISSKSKRLFFLIAIALSILLQFYLAQPNPSLFLKNNILEAEVVDTLVYENVDGTYSSQNGYGDFILSPPDTPISGIYLNYVKPLNITYHYNIFLNTKEGDTISRDVLFNVGEPYSEFYYLSIPTQVYDSITVRSLGPEFDDVGDDETKTFDFYIGNDPLPHIEKEAAKYSPPSTEAMTRGADENLKLSIDQLYFVTEPWNETLLVLSKISFLNTVVLTVLLYLSISFLWLRRTQWQYFTPYLILFSLYFLFFLSSPLFGDDLLMFSHVKENYGLFEYLNIRYDVWSSRVIIEGFIYYLVHHINLWALLTAGLCVLFTYSMTVLLNLKDPIYHWICVALFLSYPLSYFSDVGWVASTTNYLWVAALQMYSFIYLKKRVFSEKVSPVCYVTTLLATIYAANQEQSAALLLGFYLVLSCYLIAQKRPVKPLLGHLAIILSSLVFHLVAPGNHTRSLNVVFADALDASFLTKVEMGYSSSLINLTYSIPSFFFVFTVVMLLLSIHQKKYIATFCSCFLIFVTLYRTSFSHLELIPFLSNLELFFTPTGTNPSFSQVSSLAPVLFLTCYFIAILLGTYLSFENKKTGLFSVIVLCAGLCSRILLGFSTTLFARGVRTYFYLHFAIFFCTLMLLHELFQKKNLTFHKLLSATLSGFSPRHQPRNSLFNRKTMSKATIFPKDKKGPLYDKK